MSNVLPTPSPNKWHSHPREKGFESSTRFQRTIVGKDIRHVVFDLEYHSYLLNNNSDCYQHLRMFWNFVEWFRLLSNVLHYSRNLQRMTIPVLQ